MFWGTAKPGTVVTILSEYGSGSAEVNSKGEWEVKAFFKSIKLNELNALGK